MFEGHDIRNKRRKEGLSVVQLAEILDVSKDNLYKWETGKKPQSGEDYTKIENWLGGKLENVPRGTESVPYDTKESILRMLDKALGANLEHAAANKGNASANRMHAESLAQLVKQLTEKLNLAGPGSVSEHDHHSDTNKQTIHSVPLSGRKKPHSGQVKKDRQKDTAL